MRNYIKHLIVALVATTILAGTSSANRVAFSSILKGSTGSTSDSLSFVNALLDTTGWFPLISGGGPRWRTSFGNSGSIAMAGDSTLVSFKITMTTGDSVAIQWALQTSENKVSLSATKTLTGQNIVEPTTNAAVVYYGIGWSDSFYDQGTPLTQWARLIGTPVALGAGDPSQTVTISESQVRHYVGH